MNFGKAKTGYYIYPSNLRKDLVNAMWMAVENAGVDVSILDPNSKGVTHLELPTFEDLTAFAALLCPFMEKVSNTPEWVEFEIPSNGKEAYRDVLTDCDDDSYSLEGRYNGSVTFKINGDLIWFFRPVEVRVKVVGPSYNHNSKWYPGQSEQWLLRFRPFARSCITLTNIPD